MVALDGEGVEGSVRCGDAAVERDGGVIDELAHEGPFTTCVVIDETTTSVVD